MPGKALNLAHGIFEATEKGWKRAKASPGAWNCESCLLPCTVNPATSFVASMKDHESKLRIRFRGLETRGVEEKSRLLEAFKGF